MLTKEENTNDPILLRLNLIPFTQKSINQYKYKTATRWQFINNICNALFIVSVGSSLVFITFLVFINLLNKSNQQMAALILAAALAASLTVTINAIVGVRCWSNGILRSPIPTNIKDIIKNLKDYQFNIDFLTKNGQVKEAFLVIKNYTLSGDLKTYYVEHWKI